LENNLLYKNIRDNTCIPLFTALKDGDVETIKDCFSSIKGEKHKDLLDESEDYSNFLKDFYRDADFIIKRGVREKKAMRYGKLKMKLSILVSFRQFFSLFS
jgi:hypothetical protein